MRAEIDLNRSASEAERRAVVRLDGVDFAGGISALTLTASARNEPVLRLDIGLDSVHIDGELRVLLTKQARELLLAAGWTPPEDLQAEDRPADDEPAGAPAPQEGR